MTALTTYRPEGSSLAGGRSAANRAVSIGSVSSVPPPSRAMKRAGLRVEGLLAVLAPPEIFDVGAELRALFAFGQRELKLVRQDLPRPPVQLRRRERGLEVQRRCRWHVQQRDQGEHGDG